MLAIGSNPNDGLDLTLHIFCYLLIGGWVFLVLLHLLGSSYGYYKFHRKTLSINSKELPGISIIKPLTCVDTNLSENLKTFFNLKYPRYEILFCVQEHNSELIDIIERLRIQYPHVDSQLFVGNPMEEKNTHENLKDVPNKRKQKPWWKRILPCGSKKVGTTEETIGFETDEIKNPKIFNMLPAYDKAQYPLFLISDSGLLMHEDALYDMASCMTDDVGLVHQMPFTCDRKGFAGSVEKVYFGTQHARMYMTINLIGINCVTGMSCLIRKEIIDRAGGLKAFGNYIAEDFYIAAEVTKQHWKIRVAPTPAQQNSGDYSISIWVERMIRWFKLRMRLSPLAYIEPLQECFTSAALAGVVTDYLFQWNALVVAACHILLWFLFDYFMLRITQGGPLPFSKFEFAIAWLVRELSAYYIYFKAFTGSSTIRWRGKEYQLGSGTRAEEIYSPPSSPVPTIVIEASSTSSPSTGTHLLPPSI
ncbi:unnamed protein product [Adineta ricciae]|uniref:ceramide glucosyltransferase n=1 Tax=Adineta ricciae TaxID=249248 RepID=A0A813W1V4_ADIRI|nr:unnamed protein product [Adineta ricciae]CAF0844505.1 unnamed protein product [Adineta ricciae]